MGKAALFAIAGFVLVGSFYSLSSQRGTVATTQRLAGHQYEVLARNAALTGYERARQGITDAGDFSLGSVDGLHGGASYSATVTAISPTRGRVTSLGTIANGDGLTFRYTVDAIIEKETAGSSNGGHEVPPFMEYAVIAGRNIELFGSAGTLLDNSGGMAASMNANMHSNATINADVGGNPLVRGFGTYVDQLLMPQWARDQGRFFEPNAPISGVAATRQVPPIEIPELDIAALAGNATVNRQTGSHTIGNGTHAFGTREDPYVWLVNGDLTIGPADVRFNGHVIFLVTGNIITYGGYLNASSSGSSESHVAMYGGGNLVMNGGHHLIDGQFYVNGDATLGSSAYVTGNVVSGGKVRMEGNAKVTYRKASPALTRILEDGEESFKLVAYNES